MRTEFGDPNAGGSIGRQITLTGQAEWELAAAGSDLSLTPDHLSKREWTRVKLPNTVQHALFQAGKTSNPWYADNYKSLQSIHKSGLVSSQEIPRAGRLAGTAYPPSV